MWTWAPEGNAGAATGTGSRTAVLTDGRVGRKTRATMRQHGSCLISANSGCVGCEDVSSPRSHTVLPCQPESSSSKRPHSYAVEKSIIIYAAQKTPAARGMDLDLCSTRILGYGLILTVSLCDPLIISISSNLGISGTGCKMRFTRPRVEVAAPYKLSFPTGGGVSCAMSTWLRRISWM
jgi:hypothetical protein